jgi:hypothetical protein
LLLTLPRGAIALVCELDKTLEDEMMLQRRVRGPGLGMMVLSALAACQTGPEEMAGATGSVHLLEAETQVEAVPVQLIDCPIDLGGGPLGPPPGVGRVCLFRLPPGAPVSPLQDKLLFQATFPVGQNEVRFFLRRNGEQIIADDITGSRVPNRGGVTETFMFVEPSVGFFKSGDVVEFRFYAAKDGLQTFLPGPQEERYFRFVR